MRLRFNIGLGGRPVGSRWSSSALIVALGMVTVGVAQDRDLRLSSAVERRLALVVGNDAYQEAPLLNARNDARAMVRTLEDVGFRVTLVENAGRQALTAAVSAFSDALRANDVVLFYYAGHGVQVDNENFLVPIDFRGRSLSEVRLNALRASEVQQLLQPARVSMLILDACRTNPFAGTRGGSGLASMEARGSLIAFATSAGQTAADADGNGTNGLFTQELVKVLREPGLTAQEVFQRVRRSVYAASSGRQHPAVYDGLLGDFVFRPVASASTAPAASPARPVPDVDLATRAELAVWDAIKDTKSPAPFEDYLRQYPAGRFKVIAEMRLAELKDSARKDPVNSPGGASTATTVNPGTANLREPPTFSGTSRDWPSYSGDNRSSRYAPLNQIDRNTLSGVRIAWRQSAMPAGLQDRLPGAQVSINYDHTPLMVGGLLYMSTAAGTIAALDASNGSVVWSDVPTADELRSNSGPTQGMAYWTDGRDPRVVAIQGNVLVAWNAKTGRRYFHVDLTNGYTGSLGEFTATAAPVIASDVIVIGGIRPQTSNTGGSPFTAVRAYDVRTGSQKWTFQPIPARGAFGSDTWEQGSGTDSIGRIGWSGISADEHRGLIYLAFGTPVSDDRQRPGANLYANSLVCLDAKTGARRWHYQFVHHGVWSELVPSAPVLADVTVDGRPKNVVAQISALGFTYLFDRVTGQPIWPIPEVPVPSNGETRRYSPTQPIPVAPPPFLRQAQADNSLFSPPPAASSGATAESAWAGAALDPATGVLYVASSRLAGAGGSQEQPYSSVTAIDLNAAQLRWVTSNGDGRRSRATPLVTGSVVFLGEGSDSAPGLLPNAGGKMFRAFDKTTGRSLWEMELPGGTSGAPMTYMVGGKQFIVVAVSWKGQPSELIALALP